MLFHFFKTVNNAVNGSSQKYANGGGVAEGWTDAEYAGGGGIDSEGGKIVGKYKGYNIYDSGESSNKKYRYYMRDKNIYAPYKEAPIVANGNTIEMIKRDFDNQKFSNGGKIGNKYESKTPASIWDYGWNREQKRHFLSDHSKKIERQLGRQVEFFYADYKFKDLMPQVQKVIEQHIYEGQYANGGGVAEGWTDSEYAKGGEIENLKKEFENLERKRAKWIGSSMSRADKVSPFDKEMNAISAKILELQESYVFPDYKQNNGKDSLEKMARSFYWLSEKFGLQNAKLSYTKFLASLKTPLQKGAFEKLQLKTYQKKWAIKPVINKTKDTIRFDWTREDGGGVAEGWTDDEMSDEKALYAGNKFVKGGGLKQKGKTDKAHDKVYKAKRVGYRYTDERAKKLGLSSNAKPTQEHIDKYLGNGVYKEDRADRSDKSRMKKLSGGGSAGNKGIMQKIQDEVKKLKAENPNMFKKHTDFVKKAASNLKSKSEL